MSAVISDLIESEVIVVDTNKTCLDLEYYLSRSTVTKGLDNFYSLYRSGFLSRATFKTCVKRITDNIDIMSSNLCSEIEPEDIDVLIEYLQNFYKVIIIDTSGFYNGISKSLINKSDNIVALLPQTKNVIMQFIDNNPYQGYKDKLSVVINKYMNDYEGKKLSYTEQEIKKDLKELGYENPFFLEYDIDLKNECDSNAALNYALGNINKKRPYMEHLTDLCECLLSSSGIGFTKREKSQNVIDRVKGYLSLMQDNRRVGFNDK